MGQYQSFLLLDLLLSIFGNTSQTRNTVIRFLLRILCIIFVTAAAILYSPSESPMLGVFPSVATLVVEAESYNENLFIMLHGGLHFMR